MCVRNGARTTLVPATSVEYKLSAFSVAYESLTRGFERTAASRIVNPIKSYTRGEGAGHALLSAVQAAPATALAPTSTAAGAVHCALLGVRNSLDLDHKKESEEKHSGTVPVLIFD